MGIGLLIALLASPAAAAEPQISRLDNALTVITVEDHALPLVSVQLWLHTGSSADNPDQPGMCHIARTLLEHHDEATLKLRAAGVRFDSRTYYDAISFCSVLPPNFLEYVLKIEAGRLRKFEVTPEELRAATNAAARETQPLVRAGELDIRRRLRETLFARHPYRNEARLVSADCSNLKPADARDFLDRWVVPGNATLLICGDIKHGEALTLVRQNFGTLPWREPPRSPTHELPPPEKLEPMFVTAEQGGVLIAWLAPPSGYFENAAYRVLMQRLCNEVDGLLTRRLREAGFDVPVQWQWGGGRDASILALALFLPFDQWLPELIGEDSRPGDPKTKPADSAATARKMLAIVEETLNEAAEIPATAVQLDRARALEVRRMRQERGELGARAWHWAWSEVVGGNANLEMRHEPRVRSVGVDDLSDAAAKLRTARQATVVSAPRLKATAAPLLRPLLQPPSPELLNNVECMQLFAGHGSKAPPPRMPSTCPEIHRQRIGDALDVVICPVRGQRDVALRTCIKRFWPIAGGVTNVLETSGTSRHTSAELRDYASIHGIELRTDYTSPWCGFASVGETDKVCQMIELHAEMMKHALRNDKDGESAPPVCVVIVGDVDPEKMVKELTRHWQSWPSPQRDTGKQEQPVFDQFEVEVHAYKAPSTTVFINASLKPCESPTERDRIARHAVARLIGLPRGVPSAYGRDRWSIWQASPGINHTVTIETETTSTGVEPRVRMLAECLQTLRTKPIAPSYLETALRLARMERLQRVASLDDIATALLISPTSPWDTAENLTPEQLEITVNELHLKRAILMGGDVDDKLADEVREILEPFSKPKAD